MFGFIIIGLGWEVGAVIRRLWRCDIATFPIIGVDEYCLAAAVYVGVGVPMLSMGEELICSAFTIRERPSGVSVPTSTPVLELAGVSEGASSVGGVTALAALPDLFLAPGFLVPRTCFPAFITSPLRLFNSLFATTRFSA